MQIFENVKLAEYTTFKIGGPAEKFIVPDFEQELIDVYKDCLSKNMPVYFLGGGSNVLISEDGINGCVIYMAKCCDQLIYDGGFVRVGASVRLQRFIRFLVNNNLFGYEYLFSVPGTVGGAIYMNAGRGKQYNMSISDYLVEVKVFDGRKIQMLKKEECKFEYRRTIFQDKKNYLILEAKFSVPEQKKEIGEKAVQERLVLVKQEQDLDCPNAGSVFKKISPFAVRIVKGLKIGDAGFSRKTGNWICNYGNAKVKDIKMLIAVARFFSLCFLNNPKVEIEYWR